MRLMKFSFCPLLPALLCLLILSCGKEREEETGILKLRFSNSVLLPPKSLETEIPDTNDFILKVFSADGKEVYSGKYGYAPESIEVPAGNCYISIRSAEDFRPGFSCPLFGDDKCVAVSPGGIVNAVLECSQLNSGVRLNVSPGFLSAYPDGVLFLKSGTESLMYAYLETRTAYFMSGVVALSLVRTGSESVLMTRVLEKGEMLTINVIVPDNDDGDVCKGLSVRLDTSRLWTSADCFPGEDGRRGTEPLNAFSVAEARANTGLEEVWVRGYIVGADLTSASEGISFTPPFKSSSHIAIASRASASSKSSCIGVALPSGEIRDALNLVSSPSNLGRQVYLKGDIVESYYGICGMKNIRDFQLK